MADTETTTGHTEKIGGLFSRLESIDRRVIFLFVALSLAVPLIQRITLRPAHMETSVDFYKAVERLDPESGQIVLIAADWGPGTMAENRPQTEMAIEHLMRRRIPFAMISAYTLAERFLREMPRAVAMRLKEETGETWEYGKDWVNFGYRPGWVIMIQGLAKSEDWHKTLKVDANSVPIEDIPMMQNVRGIKDVGMLMEFTGLVGAFNAWLEYFQAGGYTPPMLHGCTSITIPEAYIYYSSKQIIGFFEGIAGAAYYEILLSEAYPQRPKVNLAISVNSGLSFAQLVIIFFVLLGNVGLLVNRFSGGRG